MSEPADDMEDAALRERLRALGSSPLSADGFEASLHRRLVVAGPPPVTGSAAVRRWLRQARPVLWPLLGAAAGIAAFLLMANLQKSEPAPTAQAQAELPGTTLPASKVAVVKLDFSVDVAVQEADFQVSLPEGLSFWADGQELEARSFEWTQPLSAGNNVIPIAVRGQKPGRYLLVATARVGDQKIEHEVVLEVTEG